MIDRAYRQEYRALFREMLRAAPPGHYDEMALPSYTHPNPAMSWLFWQRLRAAFGLAGGIRGTPVLDFGCGGGATFRHLQGLGCRITGVDPDAFDLASEVSRRLGIPAALHRNLEELPPQGFGLILALDVLEHLEDLDSELERLLAFAAPGAALIVSGPTENAFYRVGRRLAGFSGHYHVRNIYDIESCLGRHGLARRALRTLYWPVPLFRVSLWRRG
jgi:2-polyprenyl-3-methyl-5-hydroxy-6-metoxy-1,4-benzoquinol methylase